MHIAVIIPTYNEAGAIAKVLAALREVFDTMPEFGWSAVVVDGRSPDGTADIVRELAKRHANIHLLVEPGKRGIAPAYCVGIAYALGELGADAFVEFDGDGQHDPKDLASLARAFAQGADYVVGSRYIPGGGIPVDWGLHRKLLSRLGSLYGRLLLELPVHDVTSGFKLTRVAGFADKLPLTPDKLLTRHYAYKIQLMHAMVALGAKVVEVPITFLEREHDASKSTWRDIVESLRVTTILRLSTLRQWRLLRVAAIGGTGFVLQSIIFELLGIQWEAVSPSTAAVIGGEVAILSNFFLNSRFSFRDRLSRAAPPSMRLLRFHIVSSGSILIQWLTIFVAQQATNDAVLLRGAFVLGVALGFGVNYTGYYFYVWRAHAEAPQGRS